MVKINIEYCKRFKEASAILTKLGAESVVGNPTAPRSSAFEVTTTDGLLLWSKFKTGRFPTAEELTTAFNNIAQ